MTQGLFINGRRPKSKKEVKELVASYYDPPGDPGSPAAYPNPLNQLCIEATSMFGKEYDGPLSENLLNNPITFVGPDPYNSRKFYGRIEWNVKKGRWIVS